MRKFFTLILFSMIAFNTIHAEITWTLSDDGTLTISGTNMPGYDKYHDTPWYSQRDKIKKVVIEKGVTNIGRTVFYGCSNLSSVTIPNSVTSIGISAFSYCENLTSITIPNSVTNIENHAFSNCSGLTSITIPNSVTSIGEDAFRNCSGLYSIYIPNSITKIGEGTFSYCASLTSITIPISVTSIGSTAFYGCSSLTSIIVEQGNIKYDSRNNCNAIILKISNSLFMGCKKTVIPNSVTSIGIDAFYNCSGLTSITIPNSVTNIGYDAFYGCSDLTSITCEANIPPSCEGLCFYNVETSIPLYVPANSVEVYKKADVWKNFTNIQAIPTKYTITDGTPYINNSQLNGRDLSYSRTFNNTTWQALYIPFSLNYEDWKNDFEIAYINGIRQLDKNDDGLIDETIMDVIKIKSGSTTPNTPYLIKAKTTGEKTLSVSNATLHTAEEKSIDCRTTIVEYTFTGTYSTIPSATMIANGYYAMDGGNLIQSDGSNDLMPYRWYMKAESRNSSYNVSNAAKTIMINVIGEKEEATTGIRQLQMTNDELPLYDLNGRKVNENNLKPGIYVKNGKKFVVK